MAKRSGKSTPHHEFAVRLNEACDRRGIPALHKGRLGAISDLLRRELGDELTRETVRKWLAGESRPQSKRIPNLARLLNVDEAWLVAGTSSAPAISRGEVQVVAGLIAMDGGQVTHRIATDDGTDLEATILGATYRLTIALGSEVDGRLRFRLPSEVSGVVLAIVRPRPFELEVYEIAAELLPLGRESGGCIELDLARDEPNLRPIRTFTQRF